MVLRSLPHKIILRCLPHGKWFLETYYTENVFQGFVIRRTCLWVFRGLSSIPSWYCYDNCHKIILNRKCQNHGNSVYIFQRSSNYPCKNILGLGLLVEWFYVHKLKFNYSSKWISNFKKLMGDIYSIINRNF